MNSSVSAAPSSVRWELVFEPATRSASAALTKWTRGRVGLTLDEVRETTLAEVAEELPAADTPVTMVIVGVAGDAGGQLILAFDESSVADLVGLLLNRPASDNGSWGELEMSALAETGNIFGSAYLNAISQFVGRRLLPTPPQIVRDFAAGALQQCVVMQALESDDVLFCRTHLSGSADTVRVTAFFVPTLELLNVLRESLLSPNAGR
ncbi:MAG: chemotaxis protein CheC [Pirellulales bacterium]